MDKWESRYEGTTSSWSLLANTEQPEELINICKMGGYGYVNPELTLVLGKYRWKGEIDARQYCYTTMLPH